MGEDAAWYLLQGSLGHRKQTRSSTCVGHTRVMLDFQRANWRLSPPALRFSILKDADGGWGAQPPKFHFKSPRLPVDVFAFK